MQKDGEIGNDHCAIVHPEYLKNEVITVRIHSECLTGDVFGSLKCDCGDQLNQSLALIHKEKGVVIYLRQEGRGIGLLNKVKAYQLQDQGRDTIQANLELGLAADNRDYSQAIKLLELLKIEKIRLITNNPLKMEAIEKSKIKLVNRVSLTPFVTDENTNYLDTKKSQMGHLL